jgi:crotonobetaine/carnitine-CoA ligase
MTGWYDKRIPAPEESVLQPLLDRRARETPDKVFVQFADGGATWTYRELRDQVRETAAALQALGVKQDDPVLTWLPNGPEALRIWFAINYLGAIYIPLNLAYRGQILEHAVRSSGARLIVGHPDLLPRLDAIDSSAIQLRVPVESAQSVRRPGSAPTPSARAIMPWDTQSVIYTSGTTGPSKGVLCSYLHAASAANAFYAATEDDRNMVNLPLFHAGGTGAIYRMLVKGGSIALVESFDTYTFWDTVRATGTTCLTLLGAMVPFLLKLPPGPGDRDHTLKKVVLVPLSDASEAFAERFGVDVYTTFNMTETSWPLVSERNPAVRGTCGRPRTGSEAASSTCTTCEVPARRARRARSCAATLPWTTIHRLSSTSPRPTARAWRNGWFHTGDCCRDEAGNFFFVDRIKDAIRRRGENISSSRSRPRSDGPSAGIARSRRRRRAVRALGEDEVLAGARARDGRRGQPDRPLR